jgi:hypothetical protein
MKPSEYLDKCKIALKVQSNYALGKKLEMHDGLISDYYSGKRWPDAYACCKFADTLGIDPLEVISDIQIQHEKNPQRQEYWQVFHSRLRRTVWGVAFAVMCAISAVVAGSGAGQNEAALRRRVCFA